PSSAGTNGKSTAPSDGILDRVACGGGRTSTDGSISRSRRTGSEHGEKRRGRRRCGVCSCCKRKGSKGEREKIIHFRSSVLDFRLRPRAVARNAQQLGMYYFYNIPLGDYYLEVWTSNPPKTYPFKITGSPYHDLPRIPIN